MFFTDSRPHLTPSQRMRIERRMARDRSVTFDETGKATMNYTLPNAERPDLDMRGHVHVHIHTGDDDPLDNGPPDVGMRSTATSTTSGREPGLAGHDVEEQLGNLEVAVAILSGGGDPDQAPEDDNSDPDQSAFTNDPDDGPDITSQIATNHAMGNNDGVGGRNLYGPGKQVAGYEINTDALPDDDIASINSRNRAFWGQGNGTTAGGGKLTPAPGGGRESESGSFMPNQAGGINQARRTSTGQQRLDPGKTSANNLKAFGTERRRYGEGDPTRGPRNGE